MMVGEGCKASGHAVVALVVLVGEGGGLWHQATWVFVLSKPCSEAQVAL